MQQHLSNFCGYTRTNPTGLMFTSSPAHQPGEHAYSYIHLCSR